MTTYTIVDTELGMADPDVGWCLRQLEGQPGALCHREDEHDGPHEAHVGWPPCDACGGLEEHLTGCTTLDATTNGSVTIQWHNDDGGPDGRQDSD